MPLSVDKFMRLNECKRTQPFGDDDYPGGARTPGRPDGGINRGLGEHGLGSPHEQSERDAFVRQLEQSKDDDRPSDRTRRPSGGVT